MQEYIKFILKTRQSERLGGPGSQLNNLENLLSLSNEVGELQGLYKKELRDGKIIDPTELKSELGDVLYSVVYQIHVAGFSVEEIIEFNVDKLKKKWGY